MRNCTRLKVILVTMLITSGCFILHPTNAQASKSNKDYNWEINEFVTANGIVKKLNYQGLDIKQISDVYNTNTQNKIAEQLAELKKSQNYSLENPLVVSNPYLTNLTGLYVYFKTNEAVKVSYTIKAKGYKSYSNTLYNANGTYTKQHEYQLIGAVGGVENEITITTTTKDGKKNQNKFTYKAPKLQSTGGNTYKVKNGSSKQKLTSGLFTVIGNQNSNKCRYISYVDNNGIIRGEIPIIDYNAERLIMTENNEMYFVTEYGKFAKMNRLGKIIQIIDVGEQGYKLHHDFTIDNQGNIWALATSKKLEEKEKTVEDQIIKINSKTGKIMKVINMQKLMPEIYKKATGIEKHSNNKGKRDVYHLNTIQMMNDNTIIVSSRETSSIIKITNINQKPKVSYLIGDSSIWKGIGDYSSLVLKKIGNFTSNAGQHSVTYETSKKLKKGQYYIYMYNNNCAIMDSRKNFNWDSFRCIDQNKLNINAEVSMYYKYLVDERRGTYKLVKSFKVPYSPYVSDAQEYSNHIIIASGQKNYFGEYTNDGKLIRSFQFRKKSVLTYRTFKYSFDSFYFNK